MSGKKRKTQAQGANRYFRSRSRLWASILYDNIIVDCDFGPVTINDAHRIYFLRVAYAWVLSRVVFDRLDFEVKLKLTNVHWS